MLMYGGFIKYNKRFLSEKTAYSEIQTLYCVDRFLRNKSLVLHVIILKIYFSATSLSCIRRVAARYIHFF